MIPASRLKAKPVKPRVSLLFIPLFILLTGSALICEPLEAKYSLILTAENLGLHKDIFFEENRGALSFESSPLRLNLDLSLLGGRRYPAHSSFQIGRYFYINDASIIVTGPKTTLYAGYLPHHDIVRTPYSIYISSVDIPVLNAGFRYSHEKFFYETRWVRLNERSSVAYIGKDETFRDRGLTFEAFGYHFGDLTVGFENSYMYLDQVFDAESFFMPIPLFALEMVLASGGRPWSQANNTNVLMGFFAEWESARYYLEGQFLVDDINASMLAPIAGWAIPALNEIDNLSKVAWGIGGTIQLQEGSIGFYHAGATKYTFEATYTSSTDYSIAPYEYVYYPATEYERLPGTLETIPYQNNYIGYKYGENNLAFLVEYALPVLHEKPLSFNLKTSAEWVINGAKSPANPWHQYDHWSEIEPRVELLCDEVLEHLLTLRAQATKAIPPFDLALSIFLGYGWNQLELIELVANEPKIFVPQAGNNGIRFSIALSGSYSVEF